MTRPGETQKLSVHRQDDLKDRLITAYAARRLYVRRAAQLLGVAAGRVPAIPEPFSLDVVCGVGRLQSRGKVSLIGRITVYGEEDQQLTVPQFDASGAVMAIHVQSVRRLAKSPDGTVRRFEALMGEPDIISVGTLEDFAGSYSVADLGRAQESFRQLRATVGGIAAAVEDPALNPHLVRNLAAAGQTARGYLYDA
jgi:hypothetical protein